MRNPEPPLAIEKHRRCPPTNPPLRNPDRPRPRTLTRIPPSNPLLDRISRARLVVQPRAAPRQSEHRSQVSEPPPTGNQSPGFFIRDYEITGIETLDSAVPVPCPQTSSDPRREMLPITDTARPLEAIGRQYRRPPGALGNLRRTIPRPRRQSLSAHSPPGSVRIGDEFQEAIVLTAGFSL